MSTWTARDEYDRAKAIKDRHSVDLMAHPNVVGVGLGWFQDDLGGGPIIRVYVREYQRWDGPHFLEGVPVMAELAGDIQALTATPEAAQEAPER